MSLTVPPFERLSAQLKRIAERTRKEDVTIGELTRTLRGSPYLLFTALMGLFFLAPVNIPGLSVPVGILLSLFGLRLTLGQKPLVPKSIARVKLSKKFFPPVLNATSGLLKAIEFFSRPRWAWLSDKGLLMNFYGFIIFLAAIMLALPIPFGNFLPGLTLLFISLGIIERDGLFILLGLVFFLLSGAFFSIVFMGGVELFNWASDKIAAPI